MGDDEPAVEEHDSSAITQSILDDSEPEPDTVGSGETTITLGRGIFVIGACGAGGWLVGYSAIVYWTVDPWLVGPALALFLGGVVGLMIATTTANGSPDVGDTENAGNEGAADDE